jgi:hypothetical protein
VAGVIIAILVLVVLFVALVAWRNQQSGKAVKPGPDIDQLEGANPLSPPKFIVNKRSEPGFTIISRTGGQPSSHPQNTRPRGPATGTKGFDTTGVRMNLTAICSLTGSKVADCTCDRHKGIKKKG